MNSEYAVDNLKSMLESNLASVLVSLQMESSSSIVTPTPGQYKIGEHDGTILTIYPALCIWSPFSRKQLNEQGFQLRRVWLRVLIWVVDNDLGNLHRFILRYSDAVSRIMRIETNWNNGLHNPVVEDANNTDLYKVTNLGYGQGCLVESTIDYLLGEY